jgi:hypothetical protein
LKLFLETISVFCRPESVGMMDGTYMTALTKIRLFHQGPPNEMSSPSPLQCLFCNHLNPGNASFCNECGSQLHLQQCDLCGSINKRSARVCYKCGVAFSLSAAHGLHLAILENTLDYSSLNYAGDGNDRSFLPESAARSLRTPRQELRTAGLNPCGDGAGGYPQTTILKQDARPLSHVTPHPEDDAASFTSTAATTASAGNQYPNRYLYPMTVTVIVIAGIVISLFFFREQSRQGAQLPGVEQIAAGESGIAAFPDDTAQPLAAPAAQAVTIKKNAFRVLGFDSGVPPSRPDSGAAIRPLSQPDDQALPDRTLLKECQEAVAALGLCSTIQKQERP